MKTSFVIFVIFAFSSICGAEEIETRKTVKKSAAVEGKNIPELKADAPDMQTVAVETIMETTLAAISPSSSEVPVSTTVASPSTSTLTAAEIETSSSTTQLSASEILEETDLPDEVVPLIDFSEPMATESKPETSSTSNPSNSFEVSDSDGPNDSDSLPETNIIPLAQNPRRKLVYINQKQDGKFNVQLELSDVSVIVIPNQRDHQLSLLSLLLKTAQKSNEIKKKEENELNEQYSKYKLPVRSAEENYNFGSNILPQVESRAPYKVDISSTMGQQSQPAVDITPNGQQQSIAQQQFQPQFARSPIMQLLKPIPFTILPVPGQLPQNNRIFKRSIGSKMLIVDDGIPRDGENSVNDELTESIFNTFDNNDDLNDYGESDRSEFILLGATENCGPGRKRNSYQICVSDPDWDSTWE